MIRKRVQRFSEKIMLPRRSSLEAKAGAIVRPRYRL